MSGLFKLSDQSATNSRGAYADMLSGYDEIADESTKPLQGDVKTTEDSEMNVSDNKESGQSSGKYHVVTVATWRSHSDLPIRAIRRGLRSAAFLQQSIRYHRAINGREQSNRTTRVQARNGHLIICIFEGRSTPVAG